MDALYELCESWFLWRIGVEIGVELSKERKVVEKRNIYVIGRSEKGGLLTRGGS
jgi:hypothetical protein